jgi:hypothetical protein
MVNPRRIARLGTLAVGLGIGAAMAHTPVASADSSTDWLSSIDNLLLGAVPAADPAVTDFQISYNGMDLLPTAGNEATATTVAGQFGLAIAAGDGASATAEGGTSDYALASGTNALADAGSLTGTGNNFDSAVDIGANTASSDNGAFAGAGDLVGLSGTGSFDGAIDFGNNMGSGLGADAVDGNGNYAFEDGNSVGTDVGPFAGVGNNDTAIDVASGTNNITASSSAGFGNNDIASVLGGNSDANAGGSAPDVLGNSDVAFVYDPTGTVGSTADAGANLTTTGDFDLAGAFGDALNPSATGGNFLVDILPGLDLVPSSAAAEGGSFLTDLLSLF